MQKDTKLQHIMEDKILQIYKVLKKIGYSKLQIHTDTLSVVQYMDIYFQCSDSRLQLIQWLIAIVYPYYNAQNDYTIYDSQHNQNNDDDGKQHRLQLMSISLWKLGVMPFSKHTKNLDYLKCIQGLLGYENSVNLVHNLTELASHKFGCLPSQLQSNYSSFLSQLIDNYDSLVNVQYDPYGITFPPKYQQPKQIQYQYNRVLNQLQSYQDQCQNIEQHEQDAFRQMETYKQLLSNKYQQLYSRIQIINNNISDIIKYQPQPQQKSIIEGRTINISKQMCAKYRQYKEFVNKTKKYNYTNENIDLYNTLQRELSQLNDHIPY